MKTTAAMGLALGMGAGLVYGQSTFTPVGPFSGNLNETWESFPNYRQQPGTYLPDPVSIMGGAATISYPALAVYQPSVPEATFSLTGYGEAQTADGLKGLGLDAQHQAATIRFNSSVMMFGAFWGASDYSDATPQISVSFFDANDDWLGATTFPYHPGNRNGELLWQGWKFSQPVSTLVVNGDFLAMDGLRVKSDVPEPAETVVLASFSLLGFALWRRRHSFR